MQGIRYMGRPLDELPREELIVLIIGQDFVIQRLTEPPVLPQQKVGS